MAKNTIEIDAKGLQELLKRFSSFTGKSIPDLVRAHARICAVELANRTQPYSVGKGVGKSSREKQKGYLHNELLKAAKDKGAIDLKADGIADEKLRASLRKSIADGDPAKIAVMMVKVGTIKHVGEFSTISGPAQIKPIHKRSGRTGKTLSTRPIYHYASKGIDGYVNIIAKRIGYTKGGWAECARKIGGVKGDATRGIPAFAKRKPANNGKVVDNSSSKGNPHFIMTNTTPWVSRILDIGEKAQAVYNATQRMTHSMLVVVRHIKKRGVDVESFTKLVKDQIY